MKIVMCTEQETREHVCISWNYHNNMSEKVVFLVDFNLKFPVLIKAKIKELF